MNSKSEVMVHQTRNPLFEELLQLVQCFDVSPGTPNIAAAMSLLFDSLGESGGQRNLGNWLGSYIEPFLMNPIRDEQNLPDKTLAIATYIFITKRIELDYKLADEYLINYIEYASEQSWFGDHFLAFYCHQLKDELVACERVDKYFSRNYEKFLAKKHIPAISQSLIVLNGSLADTESKRSIELLTSLLNESTNLSHIAWGLWAFSKCKQPADNLVSTLQNCINSTLLNLRKTTGVTGLLTLAAVGGQTGQFHEYLDKQAKVPGAEEIKIVVTEEFAKVDLRSVADSWAGSDQLSLFGFCISLISLKNSKHDQIAYISGLDTLALDTTVDRMKRLSSEGGIDLSRTEKNLLNILVIGILILLIVVIFYFQIGGSVILNYSDVAFSKWSWEEVVIVISLIDYLLGTIEAVRTHGNALDGLLKLPILRHWPSRKENRKKQL